MIASANGPVAEFCAALRELERSSGISRPALARQLHYGRSQLYEILDGRIRRPPEWDRLVEPLVRACLPGSLDRDGRERTVADWRRRHDVLIRVYDELNRQAARATLGAPEPPRLTASRSLLAHSEQQWSQLAVHPFVQAVARGELSDEVFRRWLVNDHHYNVEYQRFIAGLAGIAPTDAATEAIATATSGSRLGLSQLRKLAERFVVDLDAEPEPATVGLTAFLQAQVSRGYPTAMSALYAAREGVRGYLVGRPSDRQPLDAVLVPARLLVLGCLRVLEREPRPANRCRRTRWTNPGHVPRVRTGSSSSSCSSSGALYGAGP